MPAEKQLSIVIGFRDWGLDRLLISLRSHQRSTILDSVEIIVSDYGSVNPDSVRTRVEAEGARFVHTPTAGPWSRARCLNAGVLAATARYVATTDADMIFRPSTHAVILEHLSSRPDVLHLIQCRDLPERLTQEQLFEFDWLKLDITSHLRPRWGMGGLAAFSVEAFRAIRGYDERMEIYGGEDNDFAQRLQRAGFPVNWIDDERARIYHIWHPPTRAALDNDPLGQQAVRLNANIVERDRTWVRNLRPCSPRRFGRPLASIAICTRNRAEYLRDAIASCLNQTVDDHEVIVIDDGSTDETREVVSEFQDDRIQYFFQQHSGVSVARNHAVSRAQADYVVVLDDDDIMLPNRLLHHFEALTDGVPGTYGGWIDFNDATGQLTPNQGRAFNRDALLYSGKVLAHGASMFHRDLLRRFPYRNELRAGTDYDLILRLAMAGIRLNHTRNFHILRRMHGTNLTITLPETQRGAAVRLTNTLRKSIPLSLEHVSRQNARNTPTAGCIGIDQLEAYSLYLPDKLVRRVPLLPAPLNEPSGATQDIETIWPRGVDYRDIKLADLWRLTHMQDLVLVPKRRCPADPLPGAAADTNQHDNVDVIQVFDALTRSFGFEAVLLFQHRTLVGDPYSSLARRFPFRDEMAWVVRESEPRSLVVGFREAQRAFAAAALLGPDGSTSIAMNERVLAGLEGGVAEARTCS